MSLVIGGTRSGTMFMDNPTLRRDVHEIRSFDERELRYQRDFFVPMVIQGLKDNLQAGDIVAVVNYQGTYRLAANPDFWDHTILRDIIRPVGASLLLVGDNPSMSGRPPLCHINPQRCSINTVAMQYISQNNEDIIQFAAARPDVFAFTQSHLWSAPGQHFWGQVPGTMTNGYFDDNHLLSVGAHYIAPYLCSAILDIPNVSRLSGSICYDTPGFDNGFRRDCISYMAEGWCANGVVAPGFEWTAGAVHAFPEQNCCACGKR